MKWLDEHIITDQVYNIIEVVAWEALWDQAKKLRKREIDDLEAQYKSQPVRTQYLSLLSNRYLNQRYYSNYFDDLKSFRPTLIC